MLNKSKFYFRLVLLSLSMLLLTVTSFAQEEGVDEYGRNLDELTINKRGPNKDYYSHFYIGYGFVYGESDSDSASIISGKSSAFHLGWLWKWRIAKYYELGFDVNYHYSSFHLEQDSSKIVPTRLIHKREKIVFNSLEVIPFQRFKLRNRYHSNGTFIDLGGYFGWNYRIKNQTVERNKAPGAGRTKTVNQKLGYTEHFNYGVLARIGFNRFVLFGRYRISNLFNDESNLPELPRIEVGLNIGVHQ